MRKYFKFLLACFTCILIITALYFINLWNKDNSKITMNLNKDSFAGSIYGVNSEIINDSHIVHQLRYGKNYSYRDQIFSISEEGLCNSLITLDNGRILNIWKDTSFLYILYQNGKNVYHNSNDSSRLYVYNYIQNKITADKTIENRIWGFDNIDNKLLYDKIDVDLKTTLTSNIYCEETKRLYTDGNVLIEFDKSSGNTKEQLALDDNYKVSIGRLNTGVYLLLCTNNSLATKIYVLDNNYNIKLEKEYDFNLKCASIGNSELVLIDDSNHINIIKEDGTIVQSQLLPSNETVLDIVYNKITNNYEIVTTDKLAILNLEDNEITIKHLSKQITNIRNLVY